MLSRIIIVHRELPRLESRSLVSWCCRKINLLLTILFLVVLLHRCQGYPVRRSRYRLAAGIVHVFNRFGDISPGGSAENRVGQVAVVAGEHEKHPEENHETHGADVHDHAGPRPWRVEQRETPPPHRSAILHSLPASTDSDPLQDCKNAPRNWICPFES